jgi:hypothetical protein
MAATHQRHRLWTRYWRDLAFRGVGVVELLVLAVPINTGLGLQYLEKIGKCILVGGRRSKSSAVTCGPPVP